MLVSHVRRILIKTDEEQTLHTRIPGTPLATIAAAVEALNVSCPSPPVPTISHTTAPVLFGKSTVTALALVNLAYCARNSGSRSRPRKWMHVNQLPSCASVVPWGCEICSIAFSKSAGVNFSGETAKSFKSGLKVSGEGLSKLQA